jgi:uncharacterized membrane protein
MENRTAAIIATVVTALLCGCSGLICIFAGVVSAFASTIPGAEIDMFGSNDPQAAMGAGIGMICLGIVFVIIPILVGVFTLRKKPQPPALSTTPEEPIPPAI